MTNGEVQAFLQSRLEETEAQITAEEAALRERIAPLYEERETLTRMLRIYAKADARGRPRVRPAHPSADREAADELRREVLAWMRQNGVTSPQAARPSTEMADALGAERTRVGPLLGAMVRRGNHGMHRTEAGRFWVEETLDIYELT